MYHWCRRTAALMYRCTATPYRRPGNTLYLAGEGGGLVNNMCFPSEVAPSYAPQGQVGAGARASGTCGAVFLLAFFVYVLCLHGAWLLAAAGQPSTAGRRLCLPGCQTGASRDPS